MVIQWNSSAAQEALACLRKAEQGLQDCLQQAQTVYAKLENANPDGENKQLNKVRECFAGCEKRIRLFMEDVEAYEEGVRQADTRFDEAEQGCRRAVESLDITGGVPLAGGSGGYVKWDPAAYAVTPDMRVRIAPMPSWLEDAAAEAVAV